MTPNKKYKDSIVRTIFNNPDKARKLYCDINDILDDKTLHIEIVTVGDAQFLPGLRNDIAFIIAKKLVVFIEHQSTLNPNMPLRLLQYVLLFFALFCKLGAALYREKLIRLPFPEFYLLYNGEREPPAQLKLSDAFYPAEVPPRLELVVNVININLGKMPEKLAKNKDMCDYATFVDKVRNNEKSGMKLTYAIKKAVEECIAEGVLEEFLAKHAEEVESMFSLVYDMDLAKKYAREEGLEEGHKEGVELMLELQSQGKSPEEAAKLVLEKTKNPGIEKKAG